MGKYYATVGRGTYELNITDEGEITADSRNYSLEFQPIDHSVFVVRLNAKNYRVLLESIDGELIHLRVQGRLCIVHLQNELSRRLELPKRGRSLGATKTEVHAPMPGLVVGVMVQAGDRVQPGSTLIVLEAMKMENEIRTMFDGTVAKVHVQRGSAVEKGETLVTFR